MELTPTEGGIIRRDFPMTIGALAATFACRGGGAFIRIRP
jgi:hypothetical protein